MAILAPQMMIKPAAVQTVKRVNFTKPMTVVRVGDKYTAEYSKCPRIYVDAEKVSSKKKLLQHLTDLARNWSDGHYTLKAHTQMTYAESASLFFARFDVKDGRVKDLLERSPTSDIKFCCFDYFKR